VAKIAGPGVAERPASEVLPPPGKSVKSGRDHVAATTTTYVMPVRGAC
jgi:hypothetical protein